MIEVSEFGPAESEILSAVRDLAVVRIGHSTLEHVGREVDPEHGFSARLGCPSAEPSKPAAEVDDSAARHVGQHRAKCRPLRCAIESFDRSAQTRVGDEEFFVVVNILGHIAEGS